MFNCHIPKYICFLKKSKFRLQRHRITSEPGTTGPSALPACVCRKKYRRAKETASPKTPSADQAEKRRDTAQGRPYVQVSSRLSQLSWIVLIYVMGSDKLV